MLLKNQKILELKFNNLKRVFKLGQNTHRRILSEGWGAHAKNSNQNGIEGAHLSLFRLMSPNKGI